MLDLSTSVAISTYWKDFCRQTKSVGQPAHIYAFGDSEALQNELAARVVVGRKRATCTLLRWFSPPHASRPPSPGDRMVVVDGQGGPCCVIETTSVEIRPVSSADAQFALDEGEGDRTLDYWLTEHRRYYRAEAQEHGFDYSDDLLAVFERFKVIWPSAIADPE